MGKIKPIKATKNGRTVEQEVKSEDMRKRFIALFEKNGWRVGKALQ